jgi:hypothetical protein
MAQHFATSLQQQQARAITFDARLLSDQLRRQIVIEFVDADGSLSSDNPSSRQPKSSGVA